MSNPQAEYERIGGDARDWLGMEEVLQIRVPDLQWGIDLHHLGVLWQLDGDKDGRVSFSDLETFLDACDALSVGRPPYELRSRLQGWCMLQLTGDPFGSALRCSSRAMLSSRWAVVTPRGGHDAWAAARALSTVSAEALRREEGPQRVADWACRFLWESRPEERLELAAEEREEGAEGGVDGTPHARGHAARSSTDPVGPSTPPGPLTPESARAARRGER